MGDPNLGGPLRRTSVLGMKVPSFRIPQTGTGWGVRRSPRARPTHSIRSADDRDDHAPAARAPAPMIAQVTTPVPPVQEVGTDEGPLFWASLIALPTTGRAEGPAEM